MGSSSDQALDLLRWAERLAPLDQEILISLGEAQVRAGRLDDARLALEKMFTYANHLGLYAEQVGLTGNQLGNFPQAFTHLSLISAALNLDQRLG